MEILVLFCAGQPRLRQAVPSAGQGQMIGLAGGFSTNRIGRNIHVAFGYSESNPIVSKRRFSLSFARRQS
jgi:hypothetical protein